MSLALILAVLFVAVLVASALAAISAWSLPLGVVLIALALTGAVFIRSDAP